MQTHRNLKTVRKIQKLQRESPAKRNSSQMHCEAAIKLGQRLNSKITLNNLLSIVRTLTPSHKPNVNRPQNNWSLINRAREELNLQVDPAGFAAFLLDEYFFFLRIVLRAKRKLAPLLNYSRQIVTATLRRSFLTPSALGDDTFATFFFLP